MPLNRGEINPLNVLGIRKLPWIPEHFKKISVSLNLNQVLIEQWINFNLSSRFAIQNKFIVDESNRMKEVLEIGMEDPKELTMFTLGCPYIHQKEIF